MLEVPIAAQVPMMRLIQMAGRAQGRAGAWCIWVLEEQLKMVVFHMVYHMVYQIPN